MPQSTFAQLRLWMDAHPASAYGLSLLLFAIGFSIRYWLGDALPPGFPYLTFFPVIIIATFFLGTRAGILSAVASFFAAWYFFIPPYYSFGLSGQTLLALIFFIFIVVVDIVVIDRMLSALNALETARGQALAFAGQRDAMFKELQHRVGNNLNMVSALLSIQSRSITDDAAKHALSESANRIALISDINRMFLDPAHSDGKLDAVFVRQLAQKCLEAAGVAERVNLSVAIQPVLLPQVRFLPVSLVLTESLNNAIEHGIAVEGQGNISITLSHDEDMATLTIANDGRKLAPEFKLEKTRSVGLVLVQSFARQLGGIYSIASDMGETRSVLVFPLASE